MSNINIASETGGHSPLETPTPTVTHYMQLAAQIAEGIDQLTALIPFFEPPHDLTSDFVNTHQNVSNDFLAAAIAAVEATPELQNVHKLDISAAHDTLQFLEAFAGLLVKTDAFNRAISFTVRTRRAALVADSLQIYAIAKGLARDASGTTAETHVINLKRTLGRAGGKKRAKASAPVDQQ